MAIRHPSADRARRLDLSWSGFPPRLLPQIQADFAAVEWLVPPWCTSLSMRYVAEPESPSSPMAAGAQFEYRQANVDVQPIYFAPPQRSARLEYWRHELLHLMLWPHSRLTDQLVDRTKAPRERALLAEQVRLALEGVTQDLARAVSRAVEGP